MTPALVLALSLLLTDTPPPADQGGEGEPLPASAPTDSYQLSAWCYGALDEYLTIYEQVKPDLKDMDRMFGTSVVEDQPYHSDMEAARAELKLLGTSVTEAEKASPRPISEQGLASIKKGRGIWVMAEGKTRRELARAWMLWALPDRCDSNAKELTQRSLLFGKALNYNTAPPPPPAATDAPATPSTDTSAPASADPSAPVTPPATSPPADSAPAPAPGTPPDASPAPQSAGGDAGAPTETAPH
ncbi:MAG TPA: hypothetical protein VGI95_15170 [Caulobacteraceae bacterium]|jgi:hypothetical protein